MAASAAMLIPSCRRDHESLLFRLKAVAWVRR
jgi:hypothetical protein